MSEGGQQTSKFVLLQKAIPAGYKEKLLGCVVNDIANPSGAFLPDFSLDDDATPDVVADRNRLQKVMESFLIKSDLNAGGIKNEVSLKDLRTEREVEGDTRVAANLTRLLKVHYGASEKHNFDITAATGKRYHLHNASNQFEERLWSNKYYRDCIAQTIRQMGRRGILKTLAKNRKEFGANKSSHKCEVVLLPLVVGILTCEEVQINFVDNDAHEGGGEVEVPLDNAIGIETGGTLDLGASAELSRSKGDGAHETITSEVIVALAYDLVAVSTGNADPGDDPSSGSSRTPQKRNILSWLGLKHDFVCPECQKNKLPYAEAWIHAEVETRNGLNITMGGESPQEQLDVEAQQRASFDRAAAPIELCMKTSSSTVIFEKVYPGISPSSTGSTQRSWDSRNGRSLEAVMQSSSSQDTNARSG